MICFSSVYKKVVPIVERLLALSLGKRKRYCPEKPKPKLVSGLYVTSGIGTINPCFVFNRFRKFLSLLCPKEKFTSSKHPSRRVIVIFFKYVDLRTAVILPAKNAKQEQTAQNENHSADNLLISFN